MAATSNFNQAYVAMLDGRTARVQDRHGRWGTVVSLTEGDAATRTVGSALVQWDQGKGVTTFGAAKFDADLTLRVVAR